MADSNNSITEQLATAGFDIDKYIYIFKTSLIFFRFIDMSLFLYLNNIRIVRKKIECFLFTITVRYSY